MRILVDIPEKQLKALTRLSKARKSSRAAIIREALSAHLEKQKPNAIDAAFGLWGDRVIDGLEYQRKLREEW
ncbi:MAG TPA: CopG family transcriptional regulator [Rhizomicrobium sp.]